MEFVEKEKMRVPGLDVVAAEEMDVDAPMFEGRFDKAAVYKMKEFEGGLNDATNTNRMNSKGR